jgi:hypothetical protein
VPSDDAIVVSAGKLRKLWDSLSLLRSSFGERRLKKTVLRPALLPVKIAQFKRCKILHENLTECSLAQHKFPVRFVSLFVSSVCLLVRVTVVDKKKAFVCCLLATSAVMLPEKKKSKCKMWSKKWYLKRNRSCDVHLLNELLETDVEFECLETMPSWHGQVN